ncbi:MAG: GTPase, partial [Thermoplasmata archaeon]
GEMNYGAGYFAAIKYGAKEIIDPRPFAVGSILETFRRYPHLSKVLPAMGYGKRQVEELEQTINRCDADLIVSGTPIDLNRILNVDKPIVRVRYGVDSETEKKIDEVIEAFLRGLS